MEAWRELTPTEVFMKAYKEGKPKSSQLQHNQVDYSKQEYFFKYLNDKKQDDEIFTFRR